jgi:heme exporter protein C
MTRTAARTADRALGAATGAAAAAATVLALGVAPTDAVQGPPQRLMYVHVPAAWLAYLCFATVLFASVAYLLRRDPRWDHRAQAAAELGVGMTALAIALGSIWGRPVWGVWWVWDPRLVTTAVLLLVYLGYLSVRGLSDDRAAGARRAAAVGIVGFVDVPVVHFSVVWWRTLHQPASVLSGPGRGRRARVRPGDAGRAGDPARGDPEDPPVNGWGWVLAGYLLTGGTWAAYWAWTRPGRGPR